MINDNELDTLLASYKPEDSNSANLLPELEKSMNTVDAVMEQRRREERHERRHIAVSFAAGIAVGLITAYLTQFAPTPSQILHSVFAVCQSKNYPLSAINYPLSTIRYILIAASTILTYFATLYCTKSKEYRAKS